MKSKSTFKKDARLLSFIAVVAILGFSLQKAKAWVAPTQPAPTQNVGAPLNTSSVQQTKSGGLTLGGGLSITGGNLFLSSGRNICLGGVCNNTWPSSPWEQVTKDFNLSASDCSGDWTSWHTQGINLPEYATGITVGIVSGSGTWIEADGYDASGNWVRLGYAGADCRPSGAGAYCGWGSSDPGNNVSQPSLPPSYNYISMQMIGYCHYGANHQTKLTVQYWRPKAQTYSTTSVEPY